MACGCNAKEAGFFDSGPYAPIAAARYDWLGPGVLEAGAPAVPETTVQGYTPGEKIMGYAILAGAVAALFYWSKK